MVAVHRSDPPCLPLVFFRGAYTALDVVEDLSAAVKVAT
jgi:hypothetical protein